MKISEEMAGRMPRKAKNKTPKPRSRTPDRGQTAESLEAQESAEAYGSLNWAAMLTKVGRPNGSDERMWWRYIAA